MVNDPAYGAPVATTRNNGFAIAGLVCGIVGIFVANIILGPLAIIFGGIGLSRANRGGSGKGMAIAGIILGIIDIVLWIIVLAAVSSNNHFVI
ncbi:MAG TPA: DUF4190 domain-containing protein [Jatrophihabitans sp.]|nr:DUF4190 domain-containing protein [Jatrophihabitans sp.]